MKTMTCKDMGGACDMPITGNTAQEMADNGVKHLEQSNDEGDKEARKMMEEMKNNPEEQRMWMEDFQRKFAELPED